MRRFHQIVFSLSLVALCWLAMMLVHELGHVVGALITGGSVERVVLHPLTISRTDVSPNPHPAVVVWLGPVLGGLVPLALFMFVPRWLVVLRNVCRFFAGFCLVANGAYISMGSFDPVGDCGEMLRTGDTVLGAARIWRCDHCDGVVFVARFGFAQAVHPQSVRRQTALGLHFLCWINRARCC